jgi:hypothetical protein
MRVTYAAGLVATAAATAVLGIVVPASADNGVPTASVKANPNPAQAGSTVTISETLTQATPNNPKGTYTLNYDAAVLSFVPKSAHGAVGGCEADGGTVTCHVSTHNTSKGINFTMKVADDATTQSTDLNGTFSAKGGKDSSNDVSGVKASTTLKIKGTAPAGNGGGDQGGNDNGGGQTTTPPTDNGGSGTSTPPADNGGQSADGGQADNGGQLSDLDCSDFGSQTQAQDVFNSDKSDPYNLDGDNDGIACESLPTTGGSAGTTNATQVSVVPQGAADTGGGSMAGTAGPLALVGSH